MTIASVKTIVFTDGDKTLYNLVHKNARHSWLIRDMKLKVTVAYNSYLNDWHPADIKGALAKKGISLSSLARKNGYAITSPSNVFRKPWPAMEKIMAKAIGVTPQEVWPSRYDQFGTPHRTVRLTRVKGVRNA